MRVWKKWGAVLILAGAALWTGSFLAACGNTAAESSSASSASQSVPPEPAKEPEHSPTANGMSSNSQKEGFPATESFATPAVSPSSFLEDRMNETSLQILVESDTQQIVFRLNDSSAAKSLYRQLPLTVSVENYGNNEKIFYPPEKLSTADTPIAQGPAGILAYYAPWGDVVMFYGSCDGFESLYQLGEAISGGEQIENLTGELRISRFSEEEAPGEEFQEETTMKMQVQVGDHIFTATLENNSAADALAEMMKTAPVELRMSDYSGFEKVGPLGQNLPAEDRQITTQAGDIVLYTGNQIVMFYGSNSWSYTRLARIDSLTGWEEALGSGEVTVNLSLG